MAQPLALSPHRFEQLQQLLKRIGVQPNRIDPAGLALVDEALSHTSAGLQRNHEQLEFLGDAVLRLAASEYIERHHAALGGSGRAGLHHRREDHAGQADRLRAGACGHGV